MYIYIYIYIYTYIYIYIYIHTHTCIGAYQSLSQPDQLKIANAMAKP